MLFDRESMFAWRCPGWVGGETVTPMGAWMKDRRNRDRMVISSKLAFDYPGCEGGLSAAEIQRECDKSLKRLGTDRIDLYYAHRDDRAIFLEETKKAFDGLVKAGKVRAMGASNLSPWRIAEANLVSRTNHWT